MGLEEFFPPSGDALQDTNTGRAWSVKDLRHKSNEDLHKLWYVLLKERNMLLTVKREAYRCEESMPNPERFRKVRQGMSAIKVVIAERERAFQEAAELDPNAVKEAKERLGIVERELPETRKPTAKELEQLSGVVRPVLAKPGQRHRKFTKQERKQFREELAMARAKDRKTRRDEAAEELNALEVGELKSLVDNVCEKLYEGGYDWEDLSLIDKEILRAGKRRSLDNVPDGVR